MTPFLFPPSDRVTVMMLAMRVMQAGMMAAVAHRRYPLSSPWARVEVMVAAARV
jgi:hypothetical protein